MTVYDIIHKDVNEMTPDEKAVAIGHLAERIQFQVAWLRRNGNGDRRRSEYRQHKRFLNDDMERMEEIFRSL